jgi:hypothetical protein
MVDEIIMKQEFDDTMQYRECKSNSKLLSRDQYFNLISDVKNIQSRNYMLAKRYGIMVLNGVETLICPVSKKHPHFKLYAIVDDLFDILHNFHQSIGHGKNKRAMFELVKTWYKNIGKSEIKLYLSLCIKCKQKKNLQNKGFVKPIGFEDFHSRCIIDFIDFQSLPDGDYKYICVYQDHSTKFCILRPLTSNKAKKVADVLLDIFCLFGAPVILQTDKHRDFRKEMLCILRETWPDLNIIYEKSQHRKSQKNIEHTKQDVENILITWMQDNMTSKWSEGLRFVQFIKNKVHYLGTKKSSFNEMFGTDPQTHLSSNILSDKVLQEITLENSASEIDKSIAESSKQNKKRKHREDRQDVNEKFEIQTKKYKKLSNGQCVGTKGSSVRIKVIDLSRKFREPRYITAVILRRTDDGFYQLGCKSGTYTIDKYFTVNITLII